MAANDEPLEPGCRADGQPFAPNNTRADGSYKVGKNRPDKEHQFRVGDGRKRGRRAKGVKNLATEWRDEMDAKITVVEGGVKKKITKRRSLIKTQIERGMKSSDRAAETAFRYDELSERREPKLQDDDIEIIRSFLADYMLTGDSYDPPGPGGAPQQGSDDDGVGVAGDA